MHVVLSAGRGRRFCGGFANEAVPRALAGEILLGPSGELRSAQIFCVLVHTYWTHHLSDRFQVTSDEIGAQTVIDSGLGSHQGDRSEGEAVGDDLEVDTVGLRTAAALSHAAASTLGASVASATSAQPSGAGVAAIYAALAAIRQRQADLINSQAANVKLSSALYETTDGGGADAISTVRV